jgi:hypothetical protein
VRPFRLAYFVSRFPTTTETFVVRELESSAGRLITLFTGERAQDAPAPAPAHRLPVLVGDA